MLIFRMDGFIAARISGTVPKRMPVAPSSLELSERLKGVDLGNMVDGSYGGVAFLQQCCHY